MNVRRADEARLLELLADRATQGLSPAEERELEQLLPGMSDVDGADFELAAAALHLTADFPVEPMPAELEARVRRQAREFLAAQEAARPPAEVRSLPRRPPAAPWYHRLGWYAAAACLALAVAGWWPRGPEIEPIPPPSPPPPPAAPPAGPTFESVAAAGDALRIPWTGTEDPAAAGVRGEVVWSNRLQAGFLRFQGLPANDPGEYQYQLWIFDQTRDERFPVDGGVFDGGAGEVTVPIDPRLPVHEPKLFAVTLEPPGGVVVSSRERLLLIAPVA